jgi:hypothetical protein
MCRIVLSLNLRSMPELKQELRHINALILVVWWMNMYDCKPSRWYALRNVIVGILVIRYVELHVLIREVKGNNASA